MPEIRKDFYQKDNLVCVSFYVKNINEDQSTIDIQDRSLAVKLSNPDGLHEESFELFTEIEAARSSYKILSSKLELKLYAKSYLKWTTVQKSKDGTTPTPAGAVIVPTNNGDVSAQHAQLSYPTSSKKKSADWNKLEQDVIKEEKEEKKEGDEGLNSLFQNIFKDGTPEQQRAMMKSFTESGGTVLSTNWDEVGSKKVEVQPPDGMEFKKWDS
ncbi:uncharacterized protein LOC134846463 [Symsagittifera roscoffensis]|uniref:uncharacterized protein LOC134846463 n=1 Tax=Symsagittifera roscoffensis TaxID=84072 RepID=UPI00307CBCE9